MKRIVCFSAICLLCAAPLLADEPTTTPLPSSPSNSSSPTNPNSAAAIAARQEAEENYNTLKGYVDDLLKGQETVDKRIQELEKEITDLRTEMAKPSANNYASQDSLKALADAVQEIDKKREADKELILKKMEELGKLITGAPTSYREPRESSGSSRHKNSNESSGGKDETIAAPSHGDEPGFYYTIKSGDTVSLIAQAYREQGVKVTTAQIIKANPNINPAKLIVKEKIFIPAPKGTVLKDTKND